MQKQETIFSSSKISSEAKSLYNKGFCIYCIGLSGAGKTTLANALKKIILKLDKFNRPITIIDGDIFRKYFSFDLGFSKKDRSINVKRIGLFASSIVKNNGICICANIAPYEKDRIANRNLISKYGKYIEIFINTPLETCKKRDKKGLYKAAQLGKIKNFTGISDLFEIPQRANLEVDGSKEIDLILQEILIKLKKMKIL